MATKCLRPKPCWFMELKEGECGLAGNEIDKSHKSMHICIYFYKSDIREISLLAAFVKEVCKKIRINPDLSRFFVNFLNHLCPRHFQKSRWDSREWKRLKNWRKRHSQKLYLIFAQTDEGLTFVELRSRGKITLVFVSLRLERVGIIASHICSLRCLDSFPLTDFMRNEIENHHYPVIKTEWHDAFENKSSI